MDESTLAVVSQLVLQHAQEVVIQEELNGSKME